MKFVHESGPEQRIVQSPATFAQQSLHTSHFSRNQRSAVEKLICFFSADFHSSDTACIAASCFAVARRVVR